jgi:hypothetical protein
MTTTNTELLATKTKNTSTQRTESLKIEPELDYIPFIDYYQSITNHDT